MSFLSTNNKTTNTKIYHLIQYANKTFLFHIFEQFGLPPHEIQKKWL